MSGRAEAIQEELEALESMYPEGLRVALAAPSRDGHDARAHTDHRGSRAAAHCLTQPRAHLSPRAHSFIL